MRVIIVDVTMNIRLNPFQFDNVEQGGRTDWVRMDRAARGPGSGPNVSGKPYYPFQN